MPEGRGTLVDSGRNTLSPKYWLPTLWVSNCLEVKWGIVGVELAFLGAGGAVRREELRPSLQPSLSSSQPSFLGVRLHACSPTLPRLLVSPHRFSLLSWEYMPTFIHSFIQQCRLSTCQVLLGARRR